MSGKEARVFRTQWICQVEDAQVATGAPASYVQVIKALGSRATQAGEWANAYPSQDTLAADCCVSVDTIKRAMRWARKHALIKREEYGNRRAGKASRYRLVLKPADIHQTLCQAEWDAQAEHRAHITAVRRAAVAARWQPQDVLEGTVVSDDMQIRHLEHEVVSGTVVSEDIQTCPLDPGLLEGTDAPPITTKGAAAADTLHAADPLTSLDEITADLAGAGTATAQRLAALLEDTDKYHGNAGRSVA